MRQLKAVADDTGIVTKRRQLLGARVQGGKPFSRGNLYQLLSNPIYVGEIAHKGQRFPGLHEAIVDRNTWDAVQSVLAGNAVDRHASKNTCAPCILTGLVFDETGDRLTPSHAVKAGVRYFYYVSHRLMNARKADDAGWRLPSKQLDGPVVAALSQRLGDDIELTKLLQLEDLSPETYRTINANGQRLASELRSVSAGGCRSLLHSFVERVDVHPDRICIGVSVSKLIGLLGVQETSSTNTQATGMVGTIDLPCRLKRRGVEAKLVVGGGRYNEPIPDPALITLVAKAHRWLGALIDGTARSITELSAQENGDRNEISRHLPLAFLAPDIIEKILQGSQPADLTVEMLRRIGPLPSQWDEQRAILGFVD